MAEETTHEEGQTWHKIARQRLENIKKRLEDRVVNEVSVKTADGEKIKCKGSLRAELYLETERERAFNPHPSNYYAALITDAALHLIVFLLAITIGIGVQFSVPFQWNLGQALILAQLVEFALSLRTIKTDELAGVDFLGRPAKNLDPGFNFIPFLLTNLSKISRNFFDTRFPGKRAEDTFRISSEVAKKREEGDTPPPGKKRPILVTTGIPKWTGEDIKLKNKENATPLEHQSTVDVSSFFRGRPSTEYGGIFRITRNLSGNQSDFKDAVEELLREQHEKTLNEIFSTQTLATVIENRELVNEIFYLSMIEKTLRFGIQIDDASVLEINPSHETNEAMAELQRQSFKTRRVIIEAEGEKQRFILEGEGRGEGEAAELKGRAKGLKEVAKATSDEGGHAALASETARNVLPENGATVVLGAQGGVNDLVGAAATVTALLKKQDEKSEPRETA